MRSPPYLTALGQGVHLIDTGFHRASFDAAYLLVQDGRAAFVDTGTNAGVPRLLGALAALGLDADAVDWVIPTHVHLDHAGGVGRLMAELPRARLLVHPRGARHMIDPTALYRGALAVYGQEEMDRSYGQLLPVPADRVVSSDDGMTLHLASRPLTLIDTPGHARHHHCLWDEASGGWFTGDTFGLSYREFDTARGAWILPTTTPVQFDPDALHRSVQRLLDRRPQCMYLTHYSRVTNVERLATQMLEMVDRMVDLGRQMKSASDRHARLRDGLMAMALDSARAHGIQGSDEEITSSLALDIELNAQGLAVWLDK